jgi:uncharacterized membrane protein YczE
MAKKFLELLTPARTVPQVPWRAKHPWSLSPQRLLILIPGLFVFGLGDSLLIQSKLGNAPWSVLAQGLSKHLPLSIGECTFLIGGIVLILWWPLKTRPGFGTLANIVTISLAIQVGIWTFPTMAGNFWGGLGYILIGIALVGIGSSLYITCGLGPGPRDGLMTALHHLTGIRVGRIRLLIEIVALIIGWRLGGTLGIGTALFALLIGNSVAISFGLLDKWVNHKNLS